jgi:bacteriorhodopsin
MEHCMNKEMSKPLKQTAILLGAVIILIGCLGTASNGVTASPFQFILFLFGLAIGLAIAIAVVTGIFLASVSMSDKKAACEMWKGLKSRIGLG